MAELYPGYCTHKEGTVSGIGLTGSACGSNTQYLSYSEAISTFPSGQHYLRFHFGNLVAPNTCCVTLYGNADTTEHTATWAAGAPFAMTRSFDSASSTWYVAVRDGGSVPSWLLGQPWYADFKNAYWETSCAPASAGCLVRRTFTLPAGSITSATLEVNVDDTFGPSSSLYLNGVNIASRATRTSFTPTPYATIAISPSELNVGGTNVLAAHVYTPDAAGPHALSYKLTTNTSTSGTDDRYQVLSDKNVANGYAGLDASVRVPTVRLGTGTADSTTYLRGDQSWATPAGAVSVPYINIQDQKTSGTYGGTNATGSYQQRTLNTIVSDASSLTSLSSNRFTLPSGTYRVNIGVPAYGVSSHQARLQNITDSTTTLYGTSEMIGAADSGSTKSFITGRFTIAATKTFEVQHRTGAVRTTAGFGNAAGYGNIEIYTNVEIWKEA